MRLRYVATAVAFFIASVGSRADTYTVFNVSGMFTEGNATGTATLDDTTSTFTSADIVVAYLGMNYTFAGTPSAGGFGEFAGFDLTDSGGDSLSVLFPVLNFDGYMGGALCSTGDNCTFGMGPQVAYTEIEPGTPGDPFSYGDGLIGGGLTAAPSTTPEPTSLLLLGTGITGLLGYMRRRHTGGNADC